MQATIVTNLMIRRGGHPGILSALTVKDPGVNLPAELNDNKSVGIVLESLLLGLRTRWNDHSYVMVVLGHANDHCSEDRMCMCDRRFAEYRW
jgi:hypothetical protein